MDKQTRKTLPRTVLATMMASSRKFAGFALATFFVFGSLRVFESLVALNKQISSGDVFLRFLQGIGFDILFVSVYSAALCIPFVILSIKGPSPGRVFLYCISIAAVIIHIALIQYFVVTSAPLGSDLFWYSWDDIILTASASAGISWLTFLPYLLFVPMGIMMIRLGLSRMLSPVLSTIVFAVIVAGLIGTLFGFPSQAYFSAESSYDVARNKSAYFYRRSLMYLTSQSAAEGMEEEYPLLHSRTYDDVIGPHLRTADRKPNLVFIVVEGLGSSFVGRQRTYGGFTPFIDSLAEKSLFWPNFLSTSGRTFGVLPSLFGSLPYAESGFMELGHRMPTHLSLIRLLKEQGYRTNFFYGGKSWFDRQDVFLDRQGIDFILSEEGFGAGYAKSDPNEAGFTWGYADGDVYKRSMEIIDTMGAVPRFDIYLTLSTHEPFLPPRKAFYTARVEERLTTLPVSDERRTVMKNYRDVFASLLYADDALRSFFDEYAKRPEYDQTIFLVTGDHRLIPVPHATKIDRFHVPFVLFSPLLKSPKRFSSVSSHLDVTPSLLAFLKEQYGFVIPPAVHWLGTGIDTAEAFRNMHTVPFMRVKGELSDILDGDRFLAGERLFRLGPGFDLEDMQDETAKLDLLSKLDSFRRVNSYVCGSNKLYPELKYRVRAATVSGDEAFIARLDSLHLNSDQLFMRAREKAFAGEFAEARIICNLLLKSSPEYHDVRTLLGRTYSWENSYDEARPIFLEVLQRAPHYADAVSAYLDVDLWSGNPDSALVFSERWLLRLPDNEEILYRKAKALIALNRTQEAFAVLQRLITLHPNHREALALQSSASFLIR